MHNKQDKICKTDNSVDKCACGRTIPQRHNSTIKNKQCPRCTILNLTSGDAEAVANGLKKIRKSAPKSAKSRAMSNADLWFSRYIRIKYAFRIQDGSVFCRCIVNPGIIKLAQNMDNGHCFSREFKATRYCEDNCRPQNRSSNRFSGEADHYKFIENLTSEIGEERFAKVDELRKSVGEDNELFYRAQATKYRKLVNALVKQHKINKWW